jgi:peptidoglycan/xylan/chitin deacetylase (PgdA/CDA1 family)
MRRPGVCIAVAIAIVAVAPVVFGPSVLSARAATSTIVSLTFDNDTYSEYTLGYQQALQPKGVNATFYITSGNIGRSTTLSWSQLGTLAAAGDEIGGKTVDNINLTTLTAQQQINEICNDRQTIIQHGIVPFTFAYPGGAGYSNTTIEGEVQNCGYGNARSASSPTYAETLPPQNWLALHAFAPSGQLTLSYLETLVTNAASHSGGLVPIVMQKVCSSTLDNANYSACTASSGWVDLGDLNTFLSWVQNAGQSGGAPSGSAFATIGAAAKAADVVLPATTISCNSAPCQSTTYSGTVAVAMAAIDLGSGVASTHYTTDGTIPTLTSPAYHGSFPLTAAATVQFRSWDNAGNVEATHSQVVQVQQQAPDTTPPTTTISCNSAACTSAGYTAPVTVALMATDNPGGWGVDKTYYTTDGSTPTTSSTVYTGPFTQKQTVTVKFFSTDLAGNVEQVESQTILFTIVVSITFDDGDLSQYAVGFVHGLQPHNLHATFYNVSSYTGVNAGAMTWSDLTTLYNNGDEIGGHTVDHIDLTSSSYTLQQKTAEVCNDRQTLIQHGLDPVSFAYPFGAYNTGAEQIVQGCGYASGRATGGLDTAGAGAGPVYAETMPPKDPYATRTEYNYLVGAPLTLAYLQSAITAAAQNGGGWVPLVLHEICSQTYDPADYNTCTGTYAATELATFNSFLDWLQNAGQPNGAPAGTVVKTIRQVITGPDVTAPTTTISCDGAPCQASTYNGSTTVALSATDAGGSGMKATYYTTDGSTPTTSSPVYTSPWTIAQNTTVQFFSVDNAGNVEAAHSQQIQVAPNPDPIIGSAGDIACDPASPAFNNGFGTATDCRALYTEPLLTGIDAVLPLGDDQYDCGGFSAFQQSYNQSWGPKLAITRPVPGDKDYATTGTGCPTTPGAGYYQYFGSRAGDPSKGYYSYNLGSWHMIAINTGPCGVTPSFCAAGSAQDLWLQNDLAANAATTCTLAYYQNPRFTSTPGGGDSTYQQLWQDLYSGGADVVLNGDSHWYERFTPMNALGASDSTYGVREFIVGTGGAPLDTPSTALPTSQVLSNTTHGIIKLTLHAGSYAWSFVNDGESSFTDSGSANCHVAPPGPDITPPTTTIACNGLVCGTGWYNAAVQVALAATDNAGGSGVASTYYTTNGSTPTTSSTVYTAPFTISSTATVKFFSTDNAGNTEAVKSQTIQIDTTAPSTSISCNNAACQPSYTLPVQVALSATDNAGGSGVASTYYTTDGSDPTTSGTATAYFAPFTVSQTASVKFYSIDTAGNAEAVKTQAIQIQADTTAPSTSIACNSAACSTGWYQTSPVTVTLTATDNTGGSGVAATYYTIDGSTPTTSSPVYTTPFAVSATTAVKFFSVDNAGNAEAVNTQPIEIDTTPPNTGISCNSVACSTGSYTAPVTVALTATDNTGGSGVSATYYTTDGSTPTTSSTVYTGAFTLSNTATVKFFSVDNAGNAETVNTQSIQIQTPDTTPPTTSIACNGAACSTGWYKTPPVTVALTATDNTGGSGVNATYYTLDGSTPTTSSPVYTGSFTVSATTTVKFFSVDNAGNAEAVNSQSIQIDSVAPTTLISCNSTACSTGAYTSAVTVGLTATDNTGGSGVAATYYTTDGSTPTTSSTVYTGAFTLSNTATVKFFSVDNAGNAETVNSQTIQIQTPDTTPPTTSIACNSAACSTSWYTTSPVTIALTATDNTGGSGVAAIYYTIDGSTPTTSSPVYTAPFTVSATTTVKFFSVDNAGNAEAVNSQTIQIDASAPTTTITCNGTTCSSGGYNTTPVTIALTATDNTGGSGVAAIYYTIDGSTPTTSSPVYTGPFTVSATTTVKFFSVDNAGNAEGVKAQNIEIDVSAPTTTIACNSTTCSTSWYTTSPVTIALTATDNTGGSGVAAIYYTTNGSTPTTSSPVYTAPFTVSATTTVKFFSVDSAGNAEAVNSQTIQIDTVAPTTTITCNSTTCSTGWYKTTPVTVALAATDNTGGSGVKATYYTIDGSTPTTSSPVYTGPFTVSATTTVKFFSVDSAGNAEAVKAQTIQIDTTAPTTTITCNSTTCSTGWYATTPVTVALAATDNTGGSGVKATYYTIDGSTPTTSSPIYTGPFTVSATSTVKFFSVDVAGNKGTVKSQTIKIDAAPPLVSITSPASGSSFAAGTKVTVTASASDVGTGAGAASGIASVTFYLNGTTLLATDKTSPYGFSWNTSKLARGTYSLTAVATDNAGNSMTSAAVSVTIT